MKENNNTTCDPCERDFEKSIDKLVKEGKAPSHAERNEKEHEVNAAFSQQHAAEHSGKQCTSQRASAEHSGAEGQSEQTSGLHSGMDASSVEGSGMSSNGGHADGLHSGMDSPQGARSGERLDRGEHPAGYPGSEHEKQKTHESSDAAVHAMAGSTSELK